MSCSSCASELSLTVTTSPTIYSTAGQVISITYVVTNLSCKKIKGCLRITNTKTASTTTNCLKLCPRGSQTFTSSYTVTSADVALPTLLMIASAEAKGKHDHTWVSDPVTVALSNIGFLANGPTGATGATGSGPVLGFASGWYPNQSYPLGAAGMTGRFFAGSGVTGSDDGTAFIIGNTGLYRIDMAMNHDSADYQAQLVYGSNTPVQIAESPSGYGYTNLSVLGQLSPGDTIYTEMLTDGETSTGYPYRRDGALYAGYLIVTQLL